MSYVGEQAPAGFTNAPKCRTVEGHHAPEDWELDAGLDLDFGDFGPAWSPVMTPRATSQATIGMRVAIVHEWLETFAGSESVLEQLLLCFPTAEVFAVVDFMKTEDRAFLQGRKVHTTFIQRLPQARKQFRKYLGLMPLAIEQFDLTGFDLIISSSHAVAKGVITGPDQIHISYVHSPMRYIWDLQHQYLRQARLRWGLKALYARWLFARLRQWDMASAQHVDHFIANSAYISRRIEKNYRREATVIFPPVNVDGFRPGAGKEDFYLLACRFVPYKRAEVVVESFRQQPGRRLIVVGDGPEAASVRAAARGAKNIEFRGAIPKKDLVALMQAAKAAVFAAEEDFGITMVEAQACGTPVIAFRRGGVTDIVVSEGEGPPTGVLFDRQDAASVTAAIEEFEAIGSAITSDACRANSLRFSRSRFRREVCALVDRIVA
ncbi:MULTISPECIES: glycosyltransferase [unclassified Acidisoma]|jgi:glycosyltransferase involved in cell wall biosynthesis|uniref:glycosyltransferase n=1 Tax=unclassified Acidisoma TaxID=2634065 RepID=UPI0020B16879|nr:MULTISPECIES: glycosyltransferase [unclassified Acidisoma]